MSVQVFTPRPCYATTEVQIIHIAYPDQIIFINIFNNFCPLSFTLYYILIGMNDRHASKKRIWKKIKDLQDSIKQNEIMKIEERESKIVHTSCINMFLETYPWYIFF